ncbi:RNA-protein complex protein Nop10 [Methanomicrobium antiquum]|uniref:Ribosome biogenesis protein Nop10 n=1 Tax=Methanomicrobium antiquum TaxID=487686 RepID=A0AAF0FQE8_9EURY|nr:RNA-protein complex protein Nop10 [Methanomicrobium antiquum]MDD3977116.1 RNA-protein complex protein Nop10 [Methanomicrobium sp.]WFN37672.1 RNA-protein complex protein Nop10 [Methanomicrobium antiquum]
MSRKIKSCPKDGTYTLSSECPVCGGKTGVAHPPRYSPQDRFGKFRRVTKKNA